MRQVIIYIQRAQTSITLCRDMFLTGKETVDDPYPLVLGFPDHVIPRIIRMIGIQLVPHHIPDPLEKTCRLEMMMQDLLDLFRFHVRITGNLAIRHHDINQWDLITNAHTTDRLNIDVDSQLIGSFPELLINVGRTTGHTTRAHAKTHLTENTPLCLLFLLFLFCLESRQKIINYLHDSARLDVTINLLVDLHNRRQRTTTEASDLLDRELTIVGRHASLLDFQLPDKSVVDVCRPFHMASRARTYLNQVPTQWNMPELRIERRDTDQLCPIDLRLLIHPLDRLGREIIELLLKSLQERYNYLPGSTDPLDNLIHCLNELLTGLLQFMLITLTSHTISPLHNKYNFPYGRRSSRP